ncbi:phage tail assembly chaperone [Pseudomonas tohonis]|uniref:phage tail assembly chaperone n=1 Tax=Pseudomonas tohonis TaxID=2725477 RepID=UPI0021DB1946|nr:phage tail assembly chaperone [Pseudomonas tohonis]UXY55391.1 phage tail assembly chaperone [Pseudomonas tohonis]
MAKYSISQEPTFTLDVSIPRIGGEPILVPFTFHFLDRDKFAAYVDRKEAERREVFGLIKDTEATVAEVAKRSAAFQLKELKLVVKDWGFDEPYNAKNLAALVGGLAAVPDAVLAAFESGYAPARLGN